MRIICACGELKSKETNNYCSGCSSVYQKLYYKMKSKKPLNCICKCGREKKNPARSKCNYCANEYNKNRKLLGLDKNKDLRQFKEPADGRLSVKEYMAHKKQKDEALVKFVDKIENRAGYASNEEVFVELITIYNSLINSFSMDSYSVKDQIQMMWSRIRKYRDDLKLLESDKK